MLTSYPSTLQPCGPLVTYAQNGCLSGAPSCLCDQKNADKLIPRCEGCAFNQKNAKNGQPFYNQIKNLIDTCDLKTTSVTLGAAAPTAMPIIGAGAAVLMAGYAAM